LRVSRRGAEVSSYGVSEPTYVANRHWIIEPKLGSFLVDALLAAGTGAQTSSGIAGEKFE
jgi:hypothetical protein